MVGQMQAAGVVQDARRLEGFLLGIVTSKEMFFEHGPDGG